MFFCNSLLKCAAIIILMLAGCTGAGTHKSSRLLNASSPYLREHADNPVDWYEWGDEAFAKAKKENKPLLISIGYASCHWCHVMEKECFMDTAVARIMNENFVCVKVDREERPDIDGLYTSTVQLLTGNSGWPLNAFALPDGRPFFAGTYYSKKAWTGLLNQTSQAYQQQHDLVLKQVDAISKGIADTGFIKSYADVNDKNLKSLFQGFYDSLYRQADTLNGGLKGTNKFPTPQFAEFMLQHFYTSGNVQSLKVATKTLDKMALGGIYDQLDGGFARYTTDPRWRLPHFEKMLYDNAQLLSLYAQGFQATGKNFYKTVMIQTAGFVEKYLAAPGGGYYSSVNADSDEGEGNYYAWTEDEFLKATADDQNLASYYHVTTPGNWTMNQNVLYADQTPDEFAFARNMDKATFYTKLTEGKQRLLQQRTKRKRPTADNKIITSWNSILIKGYADVYAATGDEQFLQKALQTAAFIEKNMLSENGELKRSAGSKENNIPGFLDDYAFTAAAYVKLYEVTFDVHWMTLAKKITDFAIMHFKNNQTSLLCYSHARPIQGVDPKTDVADSYLPSPNAIFAKLLYNLGIVYEDTAYSNRSMDMLSSATLQMKKLPAYHIQWGILADMVCNRSYQVIIAGRDANQQRKKLAQHYLPTVVFIGSNKDENLPLMKSKMVKDKTLIYMCTGNVCRKPEEDITKLLKLLR